MTKEGLHELLTTAVNIMEGLPNTSVHYNETQSPSSPSAAFDHNQQTRIITLWVLFVIGVIGNMLAFYWLWLNHRRKSRVNKIILGLAISDLMVCVFVILFSVLFVMNGYRWIAGNAMCKIIMHLQSTSLMVSSNMLVMLAIDRHQAIRSPLKEAFSVKKMLAIVWTISILLSVPQLFVWKQKWITPDFATCGTDLRRHPRLRLSYIMYAGFVTFFVPFMIISVAYMRITKKIWDKARENSGKKQTKKGKLRITSTSSTSLHRAKHKTMKMSIAIISLFGICGLPYFVIEVLKSMKWITVDPNLYAICGIFSASNSAINPYIFLWFNSGGKYCKTLLDKISGLCCRRAKSNRRGEYRASTSSNDHTLRSEIEWKSVRTDYRNCEDEYSMPLHTIREEPAETKKLKIDYP